MIVAGIISLVLGQAVSTYFWLRVAKSYGDESIPMHRSVISYPPRSKRVLVAGFVITMFGLSQVNSALSPWQVGVIGAAVMACATAPACMHNLGLRHRRI